MQPTLTPETSVLGIGGGMDLQELQATETPTLTETPFAEPPFETATPTSEVVESTLEPESVTTDPTPTNTNVPPILYYTQAGDTLPAIAVRFNVKVDDISSAGSLTKTGFLDPNLPLMIPPVLKDTASNLKLMPDSEIVFSPSALDFDIDGFIDEAGGYLNTYREYLQQFRLVERCRRHSQGSH